eukprot:jgi/Psemu1/305867/fgenesh1_kg.223_\
MLDTIVSILLHHFTPTFSSRVIANKNDFRGSDLRAPSLYEMRRASIIPSV